MTTRKQPYGRVLRIHGPEHASGTFWCPACDAPHAVRVAGNGAWGWNGSTDAPTLTPSVFFNPPGAHHNPERETCHSFVTDGRIQFLSDCSHKLAGQTVELPEYPW